MLGFQNRTVLSRILLMGLLGLGLSACSHSPLRPESIESSQAPAALLQVFSSAEWSAYAERLAATFVQAARQDGKELVWVAAPGALSSHVMAALDPKRAEGALKQAWDAYYDFDFAAALRNLASERGTLAGDVLYALVIDSQGQRSKARSELEAVLLRYPDLELSQVVFPPAFVRTFQELQHEFKGGEGIASMNLPSLSPDEPLSQLQASAQRLGRKYKWDPVCFFRIRSIGWNGQVEVLCVPRQGRPAESYALELNKAVSVQESSSILLQELFPR